MEKILVTGGAGFLGSHLVKRLLESGNEVICVDNLFTGSRERVALFSTHPGFHFIEHDMTEPLDVEATQIYNLACPASPVHYQLDPEKTMKTNILGAINVLDLAVKYRARVLQASTSEVYGDPKEHPQAETYRGNVNPIGIRACYDEGKRAAETLFFDYQRKYGIEMKVMRIFNTYGPWMDAEDGRVVSNFIIQALKNQDITIYGDGMQTRSFCYVDDLIDGMICLMNSRKDFFGPVNIGNPGEFTIRELAEMVIAMTGSKSKIVFQPLPEDDPTQRKPEIRLAMRELKWKPKVALAEGLRDTIRYFRESLCKE